MEQPPFVPGALFMSQHRIIELERLLAQERVANKLLAQENQSLLNQLERAQSMATGWYP